MEVISREEALALNLKYFFTGKPCKRNHISKRKVGCGTCYECHKLLSKPYNYNSTVKNRRKNWSEEQKLKDKEARKKYVNSLKGNETRKTFLDSASGKASRKKTLKKHEPVARNRQYKQKYGITLEDYYILYKIQKGKCKICSKISSRKLCVDHCHKTNKVRGLLCVKCNLGIGMLEDDIKLLLKAVDYLKTYE